MEIGIDDLDFDDKVEQEEPQSIEEETFGAESNFVKPWIDSQPPQEGQTAQIQDNNISSNADEDIITTLLKTKGIEDPNQIKFENDEGVIESKPWNQLSREEQLNILNTPQDVEDSGLDEQEIKLINQLRLSGMSPEEFIQSTQQQGAQQYASNVQTEPTYAVDDIPDDELFIYDLKARAEDITDDEVITALNQAKENPDLYNKQIAGIRAEYKQLEDDKNAQEQAQIQQEQAEQQEAFQQQILQSVENLDKVGSLDIELDDDDKEEITDFILGTDKAGNSYLGKALNDPDTLARMSWFALRGADALDEIQDYFTKQISEVRRSAYQRGIEDGRTGKPHVVVQQPKQEQMVNQSTFGHQQAQYKSIDDLD